MSDDKLFYSVYEVTAEDHNDLMKTVEKVTKKKGKYDALEIIKYDDGWVARLYFETDSVESLFYDADDTAETVH